MGLFTQRRSSVVAPILTGIGGLLLGAGIVSFLTPRTGAQLRGMVKDLFQRMDSKHEELPSEIDRMEGEGGVAHVVSPSLGGTRAPSHS